MIVILDYGMGNVSSIQNILHKVGEKDVLISREADILEQADKLVLPGVGAFDTGMNNLKKYNLTELILDFAQNKKRPILGICLGMQLLGRRSEEGKESGLGLIPFDNVRFQLDNSYKVPHMGWDNIEIVNENPAIVRNLKRSQRYYFIHSYYAKCDDADNILMECDYGVPFAAAVVRENIYGVQFHPEKSHQFGMLLLRNFVEECR